MRLSGVRATLRRGLTVVAALVLLTLAPRLPHAAPETAATETRALWVLRTSLGSPESITTLVRTAREHGFNTLLVQVRGRGDAYFASNLEPRAADLAATAGHLRSAGDRSRQSPRRRPARARVGERQPRVERLGPADRADAPRPPSSRVADGAARSRAGTVEGAGREPGVCRQDRALDARADDGPASQQSLEGLYTSPILPAAADHVNAVVRDLVTRYAVDGVHLDYARYPTDRFDYSRGAIRAFRDDVRPQLAAAVRREVDGAEAEDPLAYPDTFPAEWKAFRISRLTALVGRLRTTVKTARPEALVTAATAPDIQEARDHRLQDWAAWLQAGLVDAVCPMAYTPEPARFAEQIAAARDVKGGARSLGRHRRLPTAAGPDDREHRNRAPPRRGRRRPLLLRQPDRPAPVAARLHRGRRPIGVREARRRRHRHAVTAAGRP